MIHNIQYLMRDMNVLKRNGVDSSEYQLWRTPMRGKTNDEIPISFDGVRSEGRQTSEKIQKLRESRISRTFRC